LIRLVYGVFDLLFLKGFSKEPLQKRKETLATLVPKTPPISKACGHPVRLVSL
jgi:ATP-dependent DNA ligase